METHFAGQVYPGDRREVIAYMEEVCANDSILICGLMMNRTAVLHQKSGTIGRSTPADLEILLDPWVSRNLLGIGDGSPNTSLVLMEYEYCQSCTTDKMQMIDDFFGKFSNGGRAHFQFLPDPGVSGVRSMCPGVSIPVTLTPF